MYFLWYLLIGLVAGWLANLLVKGHGSGLVVNLIVGIVGGILGGWILSLLDSVAAGAGRRRDVGQPDRIGRRRRRPALDRIASGTFLKKTLLAMNKEKINAGIDRMAEEAKETMNLMSDKIDRATRCGNEKAARIKRSAKAGLRRTTDAVQETVDRTAERIRDKLSE